MALTEINGNLDAADILWVHLPTGATQFGGGRFDPGHPSASYARVRPWLLRDDGSLTGAVVVSTPLTRVIMATGARSEPGRDDSREDIDMRKLIALAVSCVLTVASVSFGQQYQDGPGAALAAINGIRAAYGRAPLQWDATLAAYAATNNAIHAPGSSGGGSQTWAGVWSYSRAVQMWYASPSHLAIILGARQSVGVSTCATGCTANFR